MSGTAETTITPQSGQRTQNVGISGVLATPGDRRGNQGGATEAHYSDVIQRLLGGNVTVSSVLSHNIDMRDGYPHSTTGIPQAIHGTATQVNIDVATWLASFQDPIRAILGTGIHQDKRIIIKRKYVVGGQATITPERAPARTVSIQEDVRDVVLTRYGGDLEMNLNLFLRPDDAASELKLKLDAQKAELERALVDIGYDTLVREGTNIIDAIMRSNPAYCGTGTNMQGIEVIKAAERIDFCSIFGACAKFAYPVTNLLAAAKYASAYNTTGKQGSVLILPHGCPELVKYTHKESMVYSVSGQAFASQTPMQMGIDNVYRDPSANVRILTHIPRPTYEFGAANPSVCVNSSGLTDTVCVAMSYPHTATHIVDFGSRTFGATPAGMAAAVGAAERLLIRRTTFVMSHAILAVPGSETGELLIGYPFTAVSTNQQTESMVLKLRAYLGCALYRPENVLIMPNVAFEGAQSGYGVKEGRGGERDFRGTNDVIQVRHSCNAVGANDTAETYMTNTRNVEVEPIFRFDELCKAMTDDARGGGGPPDLAFFNLDDIYAANILDTTNGAGDHEFTYRAATDENQRLPRIIERGTYKRGAAPNTEIIQNAGRLGKLDDPGYCDRIWGTAGGQFMDSKSI